MIGSIRSIPDLQAAADYIPTNLSLDPDWRKNLPRESDIKSQPIDIFVEKVPTLRKSLLGDIPSDGKLKVSGKKIVDWFMSQPGNNFTRQELAKRIHYFLIHPLKYPQSLYPVRPGEEFKDGMSEYRFLQDQYSYFADDPSVLNFSLINHRQLIKNLNSVYFYENPKIVDKATVLKLLEPFTKSMKSIIENFGSPDGKLIDYKALLASKELYEEFFPAVRSLAYIPFEPLLEDLKELKSTFINIYNMMQIHMILDFYAREKNFEIHNLARDVMHNEKMYLIGGQPYTLNDIEHGILKLNGLFKKKPGFSLFEKVKPHFEKEDIRSKFTVLTEDPLVHFALNYGTRSSPGIRIYYGEKINRQLKMAALSFCSKEVKIIERDGKLYISTNEIINLVAKNFKGPRKNIDFLKFLANLLNADKSSLLEKYLEKSPKKIIMVYYASGFKTNTFNVQELNICSDFIPYF